MENKRIFNPDVELLVMRKTGRRASVFCVMMLMLLTVIAVVVHQDYLFKEMGRRSVDCRVNGSQDDGQSLIHENEHNADLREI